MTTYNLISRRGFLETLAVGTAVACQSRRSSAEERDTAAIDLGPDAPLAPHPARWWRELADKRVQCELCPRGCTVDNHGRGACRIRENRDGKYFTLVHSRPCAAHLDPIEKKPFYHVLPGKAAFSLAAPGCNLECKFCQNWELSQGRLEQLPTAKARPEDIVRLARERSAPAIACTYSEPVVWSEYVYDIAVAAKAAGIRSLMISNGFIQEQPMANLAGVLSAIKIDLKGFTEKFYREQCSARLGPVKDTLRLLGKQKLWLEIVVLVIPGLNDDDGSLRDMTRFIRDEVGSDVPLHFTRFHPAYRMLNVASTPVKTLERARDSALAEGLHFVYIGNVFGHPGNHTYCPGCKAIVVKRSGLSLLENRLKAGKCPDCGRAIAGLWV